MLTALFVLTAFCLVGTVSVVGYVLYHVVTGKPFYPHRAVVLMKYNPEGGRGRTWRARVRNVERHGESFQEYEGSSTSWYTVSSQEKADAVTSSMLMQSWFLQRKRQV